MRKYSTLVRRAFVLAAVGVLGFSAWVFVEHRKSMRSIGAREQSNQIRLAELATRLADARKAIDGISEIEQQTASVRSGLVRWSGQVSSAAAKVWFPVWLKEQLQSIGISEAQIRLNTEIPEPGLSGFKRSFWNVNLPEQAGLSDIPKLLLRLQEIEQRGSTFKFLDCNIRTGQRSPTAVFNVEVIAGG